MPQDNSNIGLAFSGGGFRAAAFHLGTLKKLKELGILFNIHVLSTISGGSIAGAYYLLHKNDFDEFVSSFENKLQVSVVKKVILNVAVGSFLPTARCKIKFNINYFHI